jgi:hypothetical protein
VPMFRYETTGNWYKGNTHVHTTASDGGKTPAEVAALYAAAGYDFLYRTDHWAASNVTAEGDVAPLLWLDGVELDGTDEAGADYHVVCLGRVRGLDRAMGLERAMQAARRQGAMLVLAHPHWVGNSLDDALRHRFDGVEVYNHVCHWLNGKGAGGVYWSAMLRRQAGTLAFAVDDAHLRPEHPGWNGGWIVANASQRSPEAIQRAIRAGHFYSTCGPEFHSIAGDDRRVEVRTSPVQFLRLVGPAWHGARVGSFEGETFTAAAFDIPPGWPYAYLEIEDTQGRRAWTNPLLRPAD